jgi:hypothetical protein
MRIKRRHLPFEQLRTIVFIKSSCHIQPSTLVDDSLNLLTDTKKVLQLNTHEEENRRKRYNNPKEKHRPRS